MEELISRHLVNSQIWHHRSLGFTYLNNPKAGCGHIKAAMWAQIDRDTGVRTLELHGPHRRSASPFVNSVFSTDRDDFARFVDAPFFTVVRNPFTRILSAYRSKIEKDYPAQEKTPVWTHFCQRYGVDPRSTKKQVPFKTFLQTIAGDAPHKLDPHFRPQYINVLYPFVPFKFIGKLERMDAAWCRSSGHLCENRPSS